ncbi:FliI/YscN family ATPase [Candidatus Sumerlaeota bacterium]|nr:FliI/YscN family ATPase [Candidatus Sumerlaeota bacterium]
MVVRVRTLSDLETAVRDADTIRISGRVTRVVGTVIEGVMPDCAVGQMCLAVPAEDRSPVLCQIVGFQDQRVILMPLGEMHGLHPGSRIEVVRSSPSVKVGEGLLGRVLDGMGEPIDGGPEIDFETERPIYSDPPNPFERRRIHEPLDVGIRAINALMTICVGQRMAIMAGSGVGKSVLLGMIAQHTSADVNVIGLVGERGRELKDFIERDLGPEGLKRSVVVAATSEVPPLIRVRAAFIATAIAEHFRARGAKVLLMMDSVTRFAMAQREVGLAAGEPPTSKGYTPSVFALLPRLLERAGMGSREGEGSITGLYNVLVEGDDLSEPIADAVRSILDGHIVLSRELVERGHYPAIDVLASVSRLMPDVVDPDHVRWATKIVGYLAAYRQAQTLINIGAYARGSNPEIDGAIQMIGPVNEFLRQGMREKWTYEESVADLKSLAERPIEMLPARVPGGAGRTR